MGEGAAVHRLSASRAGENNRRAETTVAGSMTESESYKMAVDMGFRGRLSDFVIGGDDDVGGRTGLKAAWLCI